ncbi:hypothetical protein BDW75DRAFT_219146 [Aspergillus navahoensis]
MSIQTLRPRLLQITPAIMLRDFHSQIMMATYRARPSPATSISSHPESKSSIFNR